MSQSIVPIVVKKWNLHEVQEQPDLLAVEEPLEIRLGFGSETREQQSLSVTMRTPGHDFELALGFLLTEGIIQSFAEVESIKYCEDVGREEEKGNVVRVELHRSVVVDWKKLQRNFYTTSSCGVCGKSSIESVRTVCPLPAAQTWMVSSAVIRWLPEKLRQAQRVFEHTGGLHAVGVFSREGELELLREDVGRHNAFDKAVGVMLMKNALPAVDKVVLLSGRASFELAQKCAMAGVSMLVAIGAPSSLAVTLARETGITLIGFLRGQSFNVYSGEDRIRL